MGTINPYGSGMPPMGSPQDDEGTALYNELTQLEQQDSTFTPLVNAIMHGIPGPPYAGSAILSNMQTIFAETYHNPNGTTYGFYMQFNMSSYRIKTLVTGLDNILKPFSAACPQMPVLTSQDNAFITIAEWLDNDAIGQDIQSIGTAFLDSIRSTIGSDGDISQLPTLFTNILTAPNVFAAFAGETPTVALGQLQQFVGWLNEGVMTYTLPDLTLNYLTVGAWNPTTPGDIALKNGILQEMVSEWSTQPSALVAVQGWAKDEMLLGFPDFLNCDLAGATQMESLLNMDPSTIPPLQPQFFEVRSWMADLTTGSPAYNMAKWLENTIISILPDPNGNASELQGIYNQQFGTIDPFIQYYNVDTSDINQLYQIMNGSTGTISPTTMDTNYRLIENYRDTFSGNPMSNDYRLMDALGYYLYNIGSNPSPTQLQAISTWLFSVRDNPSDPNHALYVGSTPATQGMFESLMSDPEGTALYNELTALEAQFPYYTPLVQAIMSGIEGPPYDHAEIAANITKVFAQTYPNPNGTSYDVFMKFNLDPAEGLAFVTSLNNIAFIPFNDACPPLPTPTPQDIAFGAIVSWVSANPSDPMIALANAFLASIKSNIGSSGDISQIPQLFTNIMKDPNFFTEFPTVNPNSFGSLQNFVAVMNSTGVMTYVLPDYTFQYLQAGLLPPLFNAGDKQMMQSLITQMQSAWTSGAQGLAGFTSWAQGVVNGAFAAEPNIDFFGAVALEMMFQIPIPELQVQFFKARSWMAGPPPLAGQALQMAQGLMNEISSTTSTPQMWPSGTVQQLQTWYNNTYGTIDLFMKFYNVDTTDPSFANIEKFYQIATGSTGTITITPTDTTFRAAANYRDTFTDHTTPDWLLMNAFVTYWMTPANGGSNPTPGQSQLAANWAMGQLGSANFINSSPATQQKFIGCFNYSVSLTYFSMYLDNWGNAQAPLYKQDFASAMRSIISGYLKETPNPSQAGFQTYLNANFSAKDFCFDCPGLAPADINGVFTQFNLTSPHTYTTIDDAYLLYYKAREEAPQPLPNADRAAFTALFNILDAAEQEYGVGGNTPTTDLLAQYAIPKIALYMQDPIFKSLLPATQKVFQAILNLETSQPKT